MEFTHLVIILAIYGACVHLNYIWFKGFMEKESDRVFAKRAWIYLFSGPILTAYVCYKKIRKYQRRRALRKAIKEQLPSLLKQYDIEVEQ